MKNNKMTKDAMQVALWRNVVSGRFRCSLPRMKYAEVATKISKPKISASVHNITMGKSVFKIENEGGDYFTTTQLRLLRFA
jgi:hypothetical protein